MPVIPVSTGARVAPSTQTTQPLATPSFDISQAVQQVGALTERVAKQQQEVRAIAKKNADTQTFHDRVFDYKTQLRELNNQRNQQFNTFTDLKQFEDSRKKYENDLNKLKQNSLKGLNPEVASLVGRKLDNSNLSSLERDDKLSISRQTAFQIDQFKLKQDEWLNQSLEATTTQDFEDIEGDFNENLATLVQGGVMTVPDAEKTQKEWLRSRDRLLAQETLLESPEDFVLSNFKNLNAQDKLKFRAEKQRIDNQLAKQREEFVKKQQSRLIASEMITGQRAANPWSKEDVGAVDEAFQTMAQGKEPQEQLQIAVDLSKETGIIPTEAKMQIRGSLINGSPLERVATAAIVSNLIKENPRITEGKDALDSKTLSQIATIETATRMGMTPKRAVEWADANLKAAETGDRAIRERTFNQRENQDKLEKYFNDQVKDEFEVIFGTDPEFDAPTRLGTSMRAEFDFIVKNSHLNDGASIDGALKRAKQHIEANWSTSEVGGLKRVMKYAPEKFYAVPNIDLDNAEWMNDQLEEVIVQRGALASIPIEGAGTLDNIILNVDPDSVLSNQSKPRYFIMERGEFGAISPVLERDTGLPLLWQPDFNSSRTRKIMMEREERAKVRPDDFIENLRNRRREALKIREREEMIISPFAGF